MDGSALRAAFLTTGTILESTIRAQSNTLLVRTTLLETYASCGSRHPVDEHSEKDAEEEDGGLGRDCDEGEQGGHEDNHSRDHDRSHQPHLMAKDPLLLLQGSRTLVIRQDGSP